MAKKSFPNKDTQFSSTNQPKKNGRKKGLVTAILETLQEDGELVTRSLVEQTYQILLSLTQDQLTKIAGDKEQPMINRIVAKEMLGKKGFEIIEKMIDRANGKALQMSEVKQENTISSINVTFNSSGVPPVTTENDFLDD